MAETPLKVKWKGLDKAILDAISQLGALGFDEPTIRSVYYVLGSMNIIPLTRSGYKSLDSKMVKMRLSGAIKWGFFAVKRGTSIEAGVKVRVPHGYQVNVPFVPPEDWAKHFIEQLQEAEDNFQLPRWYKQQNLVEVWVEKDGLLGATANWVHDLEVTVRAPQGYGAWEFIHDAMQKIKRELRQQQKKAVHIIYLGDLDPSGKDIPRFMSEEALEHFKQLLGIEDLTFTEIGLSPEQVEQYGLPQIPESEEVMDKIRRDPRMHWYQEHYPVDMFVELDAYYALAKDGDEPAARNLIRNAVLGFFDEATHEESRREERRMRARVHDLVDEAVEFRDE